MQCSQWPQAVCSQGTPTRSPSLMPLTPAPTAATIADAFVAGDEGQGGLDRPVAVGGVQVGVAHARGDHLHQHLAGWDVGDRHFFDPQGLAELWTTAAFIVFMFVNPGACRR